MIKLMSAGFRRYTQSTLFWICAALSFATGLYGGSLYEFDAYLYLLPLLICAVLISLSIGREFSSGIFRNKIAAGHTKGKIFLSEAILSLAVATLMDLLHTLGIFLLAHEVIQYVDWKLLVWIRLCVWLTTLAFSAVFVFVSCTVSKRAVASIINILLVVFLYIVGFDTVEALREPEFNESIHFNINEAGEHVPVVERNPNPKYVGDPLRTVMKATEYVSPFGQYFRCHAVFSPMLNLHFITEDNKPYGTDRYEDFIESGRYTPPAEEVQAIRSLPCCQIGLMLILLGGGYVIFCKKDFR